MVVKRDSAISFSQSIFIGVSEKNLLKNLLLLMVLCSLMMPSDSMALGRYSQTIRTKVIFKAGELRLIGAVAIRTSSFETGKVLKSQDVKMIRETRNIKYKVGRAFGVSMFNIRRKTKVKFLWHYPAILNRSGRNKESVYSSSEYWVDKKHHIYWSMDRGEKVGNYRLEIYFNGRLVKITTFKVRK